MFDTFETESEKKDDNNANFKYAIYAYVIGNIEENLITDLEKINSLKLFYDIEMPTAEVLADMQYQGVYVDENEIIKFGETLKKQIEELRIDIYQLVGEEFNINSTKQLGEILFEKLKLTVSKKTKSGYSTDVDALDASVKPITDAIKGSTEIEGGLVTTNVVMVKDSNNVISGGISGVSSDNISFWSGGTLNDAINNLCNRFCACRNSNTFHDVIKIFFR